MTRILVWTSDLHLGLMTDEIDRTEEIVQVALHAVKYAIKNKAAYFVFGGDIFHHNNPSEFLIAQFLRMLNPLRKAGIRTFVMKGNHEDKGNPKWNSCLHFLGKLKDAYPNVRFVSDVTTLRVFKSKRLGNCYFTFFPHINKAQLPAGFSTPQEYVDARAKELVSKMGFFNQHFVFSHLNVRGVIPGTEDDMLKKSEVFLPECIHTGSYLDKPIPTILNGHIHTAQIVDNRVHIIGSPVFVSFGEKEREKYFAVVEIPEDDGDAQAVRLLPTPCRPFVEFEFEELTREIDVDADLLSVTQHLKGDEVVKFNVTMAEHLTQPDWVRVREHLQRACHYVKPIKPRIVRPKVKRNAKQTVRLHPFDAVRLWLKTNKTPKADTLFSRAKAYLETDGVL